MESEVQDLVYLSKEDRFTFFCYRGIECFNECCKNLNLILTPYDVLRLKRALDMTSSEFLKVYTEWHIGYATGLPVVTLKMNQDGNCPFVSKDGCMVYRDRPTSCRLYPLVRMKKGDSVFYYLLKEEFCRGFEKEKEWSIEEWLRDQEVEPYNRMNDEFMKVILAKAQITRELNSGEVEEVYTACFDLDKFRIERKLGDIDDLEVLKRGIEHSLKLLREHEV
jgi:hypothetical protein